METTNNITMPLLGDKFPSMTVKTTHGMKNLPEDYQGKWFVLFSHPGDFTPVCTKMCIRDRDSSGHTGDHCGQSLYLS